MHRDGRNPKFNFWSIIVLIEVISAELNALAPENVYFRADIAISKLKQTNLNYSQNLKFL